MIFVKSNNPNVLGLFSEALRKNPLFTNVFTVATLILSRGSINCQRAFNPRVRRDSKKADKSGDGGVVEGGGVVG